MTKTVNHSGMAFIDDNVFHIELSPAYTRLNASVKSVEFVRSWENKLLFVEAKSSFPNPGNPMPNLEKGNKTGSELFGEAVTDICDKFIHSLNLYAAIDVGVAKFGFPVEYIIPSDKLSLEFILVIKGFEKSWCDEIKRALTNKMRESVVISNIWKPRVYVINHTDAHKRKLVV